MHELRVPYRGSSGVLRRLCTGFIALLCGVGLATPQQARPKLALQQRFSNPPAAGTTNTRLVLQATLPPESNGLKSSGTAQLIPSAGTSIIPTKGKYTIEAQRLTATFDLQRELKGQSFKSLQLEGTSAEFQLTKDLLVDPVIPKALELLPRAESSVEVEPEIRFQSKDNRPFGSIRICDMKLLERTTLEPVALAPVAQPNLELQEEGRFKVTLKIARSSKAREGVDVFLQLCNEDNSWTYKGSLPKIEPLIEQRLEVQAVSPKDAKAELVLRLPANTTKAVANRVKAYEGLNNIQAIQGLPDGGAIPFALNKNRYEARLAVDCSYGDFSLAPIIFVATNSGSLYIFKNQGGERPCKPSGFIDRIISLAETFLSWRIIALRSFVGGVIIVALGIFAFVGRRKIRSWFRRSGDSSSMAPPPQAAPAAIPARDSFPRSFPKEWETGLTKVLQSQLDPIHDAIQRINENWRQLLDYQRNDRKDVTLPAFEEDSKEPPSSHKLRQPEFGDTLVDLINRWWADGADRDRLSSVVREDTSVKPYRPLSVQDSLRSSTNRTFQFQLSEGPIEWLGRAQQGDLFLVPGDPRLFQTGDSLKFLGVLFEGLGSNLSNVRFRRIVKVCRLKKEPGSPDRYRVVDRGIIELEGRTPTEAPTLVAQPVQPRQDVPEIIRRAIGEAIPGGLQAQIQDLTRQVRLLTESASRQPTQFSSPDPNVTVTLNAVRQEISALSQKMNTLESVAQVVETLCGGLTRIEVALRNLPPQAPPLVQPSAPPVERPPKGGSQKNSRIEDSWVEKLRRGMKEEIPAAVVPLPPQSPTPLTQPGAPEQLWAKLEKWWPRVLDGSPRDDSFDGEPSTAYLRDLDELKITLRKAIRDRGWQVDVVHVKVPDNTPTGEPTLQIHEPTSIEAHRVVFCSCVPNSPFSGALLFQFALRVQGDGGQDIAVLPAPSLRLVGSTEGYARLVGEELPGGVNALAEIIRPAILSWSGSGDSFTVISPMQARFR